MKSKTERPIRGFLRRQGFYIAVIAFVIAGAALSYAAVARMISSAEEPEISPAPSYESSAEPTEPEPLEAAEDEKPVEEIPEEGSSDEEVGEVSSAVAEEPLMPVHTRPLEGALLNPFSGEELVKNETLGDWRTHNGADYAAGEGDSVYAVYSGEILRVGADDLLGNIVEQELDSGYTVLYANLGSSSGLKAGDRVSQGDLIGTVGKSAITESALEPHLHLEVSSGDKLIDPETLFD
ncbi:MAG: M23 family metallopeptidase [Oscillospiraceae bacterium]|nr:M23 family metallopeptidase [Oscillospiraceae bacterium]